MRLPSADGDVASGVLAIGFGVVALGLAYRIWAMGRFEIEEA